MFRWASRILLEIINIRVERVQDISEADVWAEGVPIWADGVFSYAIISPLSPKGRLRYYRKKYKQLWDSINEKRGFGWEANPWVWAIDFKVIEVKK